MALSIADFFNRETRSVTQLIDETFFRLMEGTSDLDRQMPATSYATTKLLMLRMTASKPTIASIVAPGQEIPIQRQRMTLSEETVGRCKVGKQYVWTETWYDQLRELDLYRQQANNSEIISKIEQAFFNVGVELIPSLFEKITVLAMQVATTGACDFVDPLSKAKFNLSYTDRTSLILPALTTTARWNQAATANGLRNLYDHAKQYFDQFGQWPTEITMRWQMVRDLGDQTTTKAAALSKRGASGMTAADTDALFLTDEEIIDLIKGRTKCTTVTLVDGQYSEEQEDGTVLDKYYLADNTYYFSTNGFIERANVPTVEKDFQAGAYQKTTLLSDAPKRERTVAVANFVPFCPDPRKLAARKVA